MAEEEDNAKKTEEPTERKLSEARKKGEVAQSQEVKTWLILLGGTAGLILMAPSMGTSVSRAVQPFIQSPHAIPMDFEHLFLVMADMTGKIGLILAPLLGLLLVLALISNIAQFGLLFTPEKLKFDISKLSLVKGVKRMVSMRAVMEFLKGIFKLVAVGVVSFLLVLPFLSDLTLMPRMELGQSLDRIFVIATVLAAGTAAVMTLVAAMDFAFQKHTFTKKCT